MNELEAYMNATKRKFQNQAKSFGPSRGLLFTKNIRKINFMLKLRSFGICGIFVAQAHIQRLPEVVNRETLYSTSVGL